MCAFLVCILMRQQSNLNVHVGFAPCVSIQNNCLRHRPNSLCILFGHVFSANLHAQVFYSWQLDDSTCNTSKLRCSVRACSRWCYVVCRSDLRVCRCFEVLLRSAAKKSVRSPVFLVAQFFRSSRSVVLVIFI